jgi:hypothetical protein
MKQEATTLEQNISHFPQLNEKASDPEYKGETTVTNDKSYEGLDFANKLLPCNITVP